MATYEYSCDCGFNKEVSKPMSESGTPEVCDICKNQMTKKFSQTAPPQFVGGSKATVSMNIKPKRG